MKKRIEGVRVYGIDIGKNSFHVVGLDCTGKPVLHSKFRRDRLLALFVNTPAALIGMESCPGSQWLARKLQASGHTVRIIPAQFVKPYVKSNKNDMVDAEGDRRSGDQAHDALRSGQTTRTECASGAASRA